MARRPIPPIDPILCYHEVGHAFAAWYVGARLYQVQARSQKKIARNKPLVMRGGKIYKPAAGASETFVSFETRAHTATKFGMRNARKEWINQLFISLAGPINSVAIYRKNLNWCLNLYPDDQNKINKCRTMALIGSGEYGAMEIAAARILNEPRSLCTMAILHKKLSRTGRIWGRDAEAICLANYGGRPTKPWFNANRR